MPYIDAVIRECLRLHDPATLVFRRALQDIAVGENLVIPKVGGHQTHAKLLLLLPCTRPFGLNVVPIKAMRSLGSISCAKMGAPLVISRWVTS